MEETKVELNSISSSASESSPQATAFALQSPEPLTPRTFSSACGNYLLRNPSENLPSSSPIFTIMDVKFTSWKSNFTDLSSNEEVVLNDLGMINLTIGMEVFIDSSVFEIPKQLSFTIFGFIEPISGHDVPVSIINSNRDNSFHVVSADKLKISKDPKNLQEVVKERFSGFIQWLQHILK